MAVARHAAALAALGVAAACSSSVKPEGAGRVVLAITVDWEGAFLSDDGLDMMTSLRGRLPAVPFTHFVSAAYFTKEAPDPDTAAVLAGQVRPGDELAIHVHAWRSLVRMAGVEVRLAPSFLTGNDQLVELEGGDTGFDSDLDNYSVDELRAIIATSRRLLAAAGPTPSTSFRAGGYLGTSKVLEAARAEGLRIDSSAIDHRLVPADDESGPAFRGRIRQIWPTIDSSSQPYTIKTASGDILEVPIAAFVEDVTPAEVVELVRRAQARLAKAPQTDVFVVLGLHQETAHEVGPALLEALEKVRADPALAGVLRYATIEAAAKSAKP